MEVGHAGGQMRELAIDEPQIVDTRESDPDVSKNDRLRSSSLVAVDTFLKSETSSAHMPARVPPAFAAWFATASTLPDSPCELHRVTPGVGDGS